MIVPVHSCFWKLELCTRSLYHVNQHGYRSKPMQKDCIDGTRNAVITRIVIQSSLMSVQKLDAPDVAAFL